MHALATLPRIEQVYVNAPDDMPRGKFNRKLFSCAPPRGKPYRRLDQLRSQPVFGDDQLQGHDHACRTAGLLP